ncbi:PREDICTED: transcription initiation protein SPT3 homolog [Dufourea novaeangliae]|uniref:Transcription initiation protein SPT3 like protein n=1 Tax=Dufourea novaeangliae TaxID=178035 RepID=A0A154PF75_DUFNO|nr:PREDICTED: transcription initiation protein SPT3 homolog [Dufourea novaeangliae]KZC10536.1 Transcription initiation protein SPT3 like protein [Dufourea novaeangliae]
MAESTFSKSATDSQFVRNEPVNYTAEIRQMMHGFGDSSEPLMESAKIVEEVVLQQMRTIVRKASEISERQENSKKATCISAEDLIFLLRKDKVKLQRLMKYLELKEYKSSIHKAIESDVPKDILNNENLEDSKHRGPFYSFLNQIDNTGELLEDASTVDEIKQHRCIRAEIMTRSMDEARYLKFSKARNASFANKNRHKFSDWLSSDNDITITKPGYTILGYLAYEMVAQIVDLAFLVRQDQNKIYGDAIDRLRLSYVNPHTYKPYYHGKVAVTKPITPAEIIEALRRYWSPQLDMTGPFNRCSMRKPHLKLLAC